MGGALREWLYAINQRHLAIQVAGIIWMNFSLEDRVREGAAIRIGDCSSAFAIYFGFLLFIIVAVALVLFCLNFLLWGGVLMFLPTPKQKQKET